MSHHHAMSSNPSRQSSSRRTDGPVAAGLHGTLLLACGAALLLTGCAETKFLKWHKEELHRATPQNPAAEILCVWHSAEGAGLNGLPTRGFAGQILFFTGQHPSPVEVDGDVRVYVFDNHGTVEEQSKPIHQFDFKGPAWNSYLRDGTFGPSYNIFIPYTRPGVHHAECSLRVRFQPKDGPTVYSPMTSVTLPGRLEPPDPLQPSVLEPFGLREPGGLARRQTADRQPQPRSPAPGTSPTQVAPVGRLDPRTRQLRPSGAEPPHGGPTRILQAGGADPTGSADERLDRLERMLEQLLLNQHGGSARPRSAADRDEAESLSGRGDRHPASRDHTWPAPHHSRAGSHFRTGSEMDAPPPRRFQATPAADRGTWQYDDRRSDGWDGGAWHQEVRSAAAAPRRPTAWQAEAAVMPPGCETTACGVSPPRPLRRHPLEHVERASDASSIEAFEPPSAPPRRRHPLEWIGDDE